MNRSFKFAAVAALAAASASSFAALPDGVSAAITAASTDGVALLGLLSVAGASVFLLAKVLGRFGVKL